MIEPQGDAVEVALGDTREVGSSREVLTQQDVPVGIMPGQGLNNGQPSFLAFLISIGQAREGEHAVHIGAGVGYYTAVIARLVGRAGKITAIEYEPDLAKRAAVNLSSYPGVDVIAGDGSAVSLDPADVIYVNAGATRPAETWLNALKDGGRLVLPLTTSFTTDEDHAMTHLARWMSRTRLYRTDDIPEERCWVRAPGWSLAYR